MAAYIITYRFRKRGKNNSERKRDERRSNFLSTLEEIVGASNIKNFGETKTTSTRIIRIKKSLRALTKTILKKEEEKGITVLHKSDIILFFKIYDEENEEYSGMFDRAGMIDGKKYKKNKAITDFIKDSPLD